MSQSVCFNAEITKNCRFLVLGSMPGKVSLLEQAYYAHPRNTFWPIMSRVFNFSADLTYQEKLIQLNEAGVGLWDVIAACYREGSLDSAIQPNGLQINDFAACFRLYPNLGKVLLNGQKAAQLFIKKALPELEKAGFELQYSIMPSTSPAFASMTFDQKLVQWQRAFDL